METTIFKKVMARLQEEKIEYTLIVTSEKLTTIQVDRIYRYIVIKGDKESLSPLSHFTIYASVNKQDTNDYLKTPYASLADSSGNFVCRGKIYNNYLYVDIPVFSLGLDPSAIGRNTTIFFTVTLFNGEEIIESEVIPLKANIQFFSYLYTRIEKPRFEDFKCLPILKLYTLKTGAWTPEKTELFKDAVTAIYNKELAESKSVKQFMEQEVDTASDEIFSIYRRRTLDDRVTITLLDNIIKALQLGNMSNDEIEKELNDLSEQIWIDEDYLQHAITGLQTM